MNAYVSVAEHTTDLEHAERLIRGNTGVFSLDREQDRRFFFDLVRGGDHRGLVSRFRYGASFATQGVHDVFTIATVTDGALQWEMGDERGTERSGPFLQPAGVTMLSKGRHVQAEGAYLPADFMQEVARQTYAVDHVPLRFESPWPVSSRHAAFWSRTADFAAAARDSGALEHDLVRAAVLRNLAVALLECFRLAGDRDARLAGAAAARRMFRTATRFLEDLASLPITAGDAAQAVGVPMSELDRIFRNLAGMPVSAYLRRVRLSAAHEELLRGDPDTDARGVALRWGFATYDSFRRAYRREYGVPPLRRTRP